jgi:hypothetical protein
MIRSSLLAGPRARGCVAGDPEAGEDVGDLPGLLVVGAEEENQVVVQRS